MSVEPMDIIREIVPTRPDASLHIFEVREKYFRHYWHYHPEIEFTLVLQGRGTRTIGDSIEHFERGDLCLVGSNLAHCWFSEKPLRPIGHCIVLQFPPDLLDQKVFAVPEFYPLRQLLILARRGLRVEGATRAAVTARIKKMWRYPAGHWEQLLILLGILGILTESTECVPLATARSEPETETDKHDHEKINRILEITNVSPSEFPSQKAAAEAVRLSPPAFSRFFKRHMSKTYIDFVIDLRIAHVCRSLINTRTGITEIAFTAGFESLSNFNRQFRKRKGISPHAWRGQALRQFSS